MSEIDKLHEVIARRSKAIENLLKSLKHLPTERQFTILTSWYSIEQLEDIAEFQDREDGSVKPE